jgi:DNA-nicking Smr family endonuclease
MKKHDSINRLLSNLPEFLKRNKIPLKESQQDEGCVYFEAMKDVKEMNQNNNRVKKKVNTRHVNIQEKDDVKRLLENAIQDQSMFNVTNLPEYMEGYVDNMNPLAMEKLRNGEFSIQKVLDLHGYTIEAANKLFQECIRGAITSGLHCVKVIHGRGLKSKDTPVLKESIKEWIVKAMHRKWVIAFSSSRMCDGGPGATYILLKKKPEKKRIHIIG